MTPFTTLTSIAAPLSRDNVDTDTIIPSREMRSTGKTGLANGLFAPWRYSDADTRTPDPAFVLNDARYADAQILLVGRNFGCGSSREHAVWALAEYGIRCIIAESFAPIFRNNCVRNGVLPIELGRPILEEWVGAMLTIDLEQQSIASGDGRWEFSIDEEARTILIEGLDAIDLTLKHAAAIAAWQAQDRNDRPWVYLNPRQAKLGEGDDAKHGGGVSRLPTRTNAAVMGARKLRREMSLPEVILWRELRKRPGNLKFRHQYPASRYTLDFYCAAAKLCIEVDGAHHDRGQQPGMDDIRNQFLAEHGIATIRLNANEIFKNLENALAHIVIMARERIPLHRSSNGPPPHSANGEEV